MLVNQRAELGCQSERQANQGEGAGRASEPLGGDSEATPPTTVGRGALNNGAFRPIRDGGVASAAYVTRDGRGCNRALGHFPANPQPALPNRKSRAVRFQNLRIFFGSCLLPTLPKVSRGAASALPAGQADLKGPGTGQAKMDLWFRVESTLMT